MKGNGRVAEIWSGERESGWLASGEAGVLRPERKWVWEDQLVEGRGRSIGP